MTTFPSAPLTTTTTTCGTRRKASVSSEKSTFFFRGRNSTLPFGPRNSTNWLFSHPPPKSSAHASGAWRHSHLLVIFSIWDFYFDISEWHILPARAWTPALMLHLTNPCAKRKVLSLTKPKGKIYKTKSLGHYITEVRSWKHLFVVRLQVSVRWIPVG